MLVVTHRVVAGALRTVAALLLQGLTRVHARVVIDPVIACKVKALVLHLRTRKEGGGWQALTLKFWDLIKTSLAHLTRAPRHVIVIIQRVLIHPNRW